MERTPKAVRVTAIQNHHVLIEFDNGERKDFDVTPYIKGSYYGKLSDENYFCQVKPDGYSISWPDGQDLCPSEIYCDSAGITN